MIVNKLPAEIKRRWFAHIKTASHMLKFSNLIELNEGLQEGSLVRERKKTEATKQFRESSNRGKQNRSTKNSTFTNDREVRFQKCSLDDKDKPL